MKILCCTYRDWAKKIYNNLEKTYPQHDIIRINSKEELMYYRIFKNHFGDLEDLSWVGRTKGAPKR